MTDLVAKNIASLLNANTNRMDANETAFLERQIVQLRTKTYDELFGPNIGRTLVPKAGDIASSVSRYSYQVFSTTGAAKIIADGVDDLPRIDVDSKEVLGNVYGLGASYGWGLWELREAIRLRIPLSDKKAMAARNAIETAIDDSLFQGFPENDGGAASVIKTTGLSNNPGSIAQGIIALTNWTGATPVDTMVSELNTMIAAVRSRTLQNYQATDIALGLDRYELLSNTPVGVDNRQSVLSSILENNPAINTISPWYKLDTAGANGTGRAICYQKSPDVLEGVIPQEFESLAPQQRNLDIVIPCTARAGGVQVFQPGAVVTGDFAA